VYAHLVRFKKLLLKPIHFGKNITIKGTPKAWLRFMENLKLTFIEIIENQNHALETKNYSIAMSPD
jgi:hypothetical protein